jgi:hypothetical protein
MSTVTPEMIGFPAKEAPSMFTTRPEIDRHVRRRRHDALDRQPAVGMGCAGAWGQRLRCRGGGLRFALQSGGAAPERPGRRLRRSSCTSAAPRRGGGDLRPGTGPLGGLTVAACAGWPRPGPHARHRACSPHPSPARSTRWMVLLVATTARWSAAGRAGAGAIGYARDGAPAGGAHSRQTIASVKDRCPRGRVADVRGGVAAQWGPASRTAPGTLFRNPVHGRHVRARW